MNPPFSVLSRLSARERVLAAISGVLVVGLALFYGLLTPGLDARSSAESRNARAAADIAEARGLASDVSVRSPDERLLAALTASAAAHGLTVIEAQLVDGSAVLRVASASSRDVLAWAAAASHTALPLRSLAIARTGTETLAIEAEFSGNAS